jgi:hypothetical protein
MMASLPLVDIVCATYNGAPWLEAFVASLPREAPWRLWIRDDSSTDATVAIIRALATKDPRIHLVESPEGRLGVVQSFGRLLAALPADAQYVMCADQDDVWLENKFPLLLTRMREIESRHPGPVLIHSDLRVVDAELRELAPSFWAFTHLQPEPGTLERLVLQGIVTGATLLVNRAVIERALPIPPEAIMHDWWLACVAAGSGVVSAVHTPTVAYRQHGGNAVGAQLPAWKGDLVLAPQRIRDALAQRAKARRAVDETAKQAGALLARIGEALPPHDRTFLADYAGIPDLGWWGRKRRILRWRVRAEHGVLRNIGMLVRG